ncbi:alpha/beta hydrolase [Phenylobacterium montanum]|uniref:Alpha/beta hydrolase n=1 Tax=Phenylobacterium montanum TaxID=2823693 RepID=A0A975G4N9_9CAUL|nr:alpha/beta hydrolase [Caulobacter sp. S6]QUD90504.1 alpha/beta hydrolase [Caulobacter sp. S6]
MTPGDRNEVIHLWPAGPPRTIEGAPPESTFQPPVGVAAGTVMLRNVSKPTLTVYRPEPGKANGSAVVVCPGGGWRILAWKHEGTDVAEWFAQRGYTAFLLKYRVSPTAADPAAFAAQMAQTDGLLAEPLTAAKAPTAIEQIVRDEKLRYAREVAADDGRRALAIVRERAAEYGLDPDRVGMIGFSAGAFLVVDVAIDPQGPPPAFLAPIYGGETRGRPVPADAPPLFTVIAHDDRLLFHMVEGLYLDWSAADRSCELHIFARGAHGFGMVRQGLPSDRWIDLLGGWLADKGFG